MKNKNHYQQPIRNPHRIPVDTDHVQHMVSVIDSEDRWVTYPEMPSKFVDGVEFIVVRRPNETRHHLIRKESVKKYVPNPFSML